MIRSLRSFFKFVTASPSRTINLIAILIVAAAIPFTVLLSQNRQNLSQNAATCAPKPACLSAKPPCLIAEPAEGWCPSSNPTIYQPHCPQVVIPARNPVSGRCVNFSTPCGIPKGWKIVKSCSGL